MVFPEAHLHALNAAGAFNGTPISGVQNFVEKLKGSLVWLGGTAMSLVIAVVGIMFMAGHPGTRHRDPHDRRPGDPRLDQRDRGLGP